MEQRVAKRNHQNQVSPRSSRFSNGGPCGPVGLSSLEQWWSYAQLCGVERKLRNDSVASYSQRGTEATAPSPVKLLPKPSGWEQVEGQRKETFGSEPTMCI